MLHQISCPEVINSVNSDHSVFGDGAGTVAFARAIGESIVGSSYYADEINGGCEEILTTPANVVDATTEGKKSAKKRARKKVSELFTRRIKRSALDIHSEEGVG